MLIRGYIGLDLALENRGPSTSSKRVFVDKVIRFHHHRMELYSTSSEILFLGNVNWEMSKG